MAIVRLIYLSDFLLDLKRGVMLEQLADILDASNRNNSANGITGALVFDKKWFVQVLEGSLEAVWATYKRIEHDPRHANVRFVEMLAVPSRRFCDWRMACAERIAQTEAVFAPYLLDGRFEPANMGGNMILSMMLDLSLGGFVQHQMPELFPA